MSWLSKLTIYCIECYQKSGGGEELLFVDCNFTPTCSEYAKESIYRFGFFQGGLLATKRICRCSDRDLAQQISDPVPDFLSCKRKK